MEYDYLVIAGYFALMVAISLLFKKWQAIVPATISAGR